MNVDVGRIDLTREGVERLAELAAAVERSAEDVTCTARFICSAGWTVLEAMRRRAEKRNIILTAEVPAAGYSRPFSTTVGFGTTGSGSETTLTIRSFDRENSAAIGDFLLNGWSAMAQKLSRSSTEYVASAVAEIFENGLTHARSDVGVLAGGQYYPKPDELELSVADLGIGIPASLAAAFGRREEEIDPVRALNWAFEPGRSSVGTSRGLGLAIVRAFVRRNRAALLVASGEAFAAARSQSWTTSRLTCRFPGTFVVITLPAPARVFPPAPGEGLFT